ncbi:MAG: 30S ribosomal protein S24e [Euryarchaeota archaeon]|nr:30S ribosomal protein S24e [Euryarchaeota archaeon]
MEVQIINRKENPLLQRSEIEFKATYPGKPTLTRKDLQEKLAGILNVDKELVVIAKLKPAYGKQEATGYAKVYQEKERLAKVEPKYILSRGQPKEKKAEEKPAEKEKPAEAKKSEEKKK